MFCQLNTGCKFYKRMLSHQLLINENTTQHGTVYQNIYHKDRHCISIILRMGSHRTSLGFKQISCKQKRKQQILHPNNDVWWFYPLPEAYARFESSDSFGVTKCLSIISQFVFVVLHMTAPTGRKAIVSLTSHCTLLQ